MNPDVLIIGGGPAGSNCARRLSGAGLDVVVLDRAVFPRHKLCAGWITPQVVATLDLSLDEYRGGGRTLQPFTSFRTGLIGGPPVHTPYHRIVSYGIRRCEFDTYLLRRSGARLSLGANVTEVRRENGRWRVTVVRAPRSRNPTEAGAHAKMDPRGPGDAGSHPLGNSTGTSPCPSDPASAGLDDETGGPATSVFEAPMLVGAGGHFCPVARALAGKGGGRRPESIVAAQEVEFEMTPAEQAMCRVSGEAPELYLTRDLAGYGWLVRKGAFLNVGFGRLGNAGLKDQIAEFVAFVQRQERIPPGTPTKWAGHPYLLYETTGRSLLDEGVVLVGDAAGLAYSQSGEGIRPAIESGLLAAETILEARGRYDRERLATYQTRLVARFGPPGPRQTVATRLPAAVRTALAARLLATGWFTRRYLLDRWFLHRSVPPLRPAA